MSAKRDAIVLVGSGRMASAFAAAMKRASRAFVRVRGRAPRRPLRRAGRTLWLLAVTDAAIAPVARELVALGAVRRGDVVVHFAGMLGPDALAAAREAGAHVAAVHPLVAVAKPGHPPTLSHTAWTFDGEARARASVRALARDVGARVHAAGAIDRTRYHAGAALVATGAVALAQGAAILFAEAIPDASPAARAHMVASLLESVAHNVVAAGPDGALASPLMRGDTTTVARHLETLEAHPGVRTLYAAALGQVLDTLEAARTLDRRVVRDARALIGIDRTPNRRKR